MSIPQLFLNKTSWPVRVEVCRAKEPKLRLHLCMLEAKRGSGEPFAPRQASNLHFYMDLHGLQFDVVWSCLFSTYVRNGSHELKLLAPACRIQQMQG
jgi:hypothetical protein